MGSKYFDDVSANPERYFFVSGNGDSVHQEEINKQSAHKFHVVAMVFNPDNQTEGKRLTVLMERRGLGLTIEFHII
jgi:hypothetical protein